MTQDAIRKVARPLIKKIKAGEKAERQLYNLQHCCLHPRRSKPQSESGGGGTELSSNESYVICLDCGRKIYC